MKRLNTLFLVIITTGLLTACGGGASSSSGDNRDNTGALAEGVVSLTWAAPSTRADSSYLPMTDLQGYRIYYGTSAEDLDMLVDLNDNSLTDYSISDLPAGSYFFTVTAYDLDGQESGFSNVISKDV